MNGTITNVTLYGMPHKIKMAKQKTFVTKECLICKNEMTIPYGQRAKKYCSRICFGKANRPKGVIPWNKGLKGIRLSPKSEFKKGVTPKNSMVFISREIKFKGTPNEYKKLHHKISKLYGKPKICEICSKEVVEQKKIHWACVTGKYEPERHNWKRLCVKCHYEIDEHSSRKERYV